MDRRRRHSRQRGQVLVVTALVATLLIGASALAVDLSVQTSHRRTLQNVTDVAALAGAHDLGSDGSTVSAADQQQAVADALDAVRQDMGWPSTGWLAALNTPLPCAQPQALVDYGLSGFCTSVQYGDYTVTVSTPPYTPRSPADMEEHNVEVEMSQTTHNGLAGVIGFGSSTEGGHSVARHMLGGQTEGFALFSNTYVQAGNGAETVDGNVYANRYVNPQSAGQSSLCAQSTTGNDDGYIVLSAPQTKDAGQQTVKPAIADSFQAPPGNLCSNVQNSDTGVFQTGRDVQTHSCPTIAGVPDTLSYNSTINACVTLPLTPPVIAAPPLSGNAYTITAPCKNSGNGGGKKGGSGVPGCWDGTFSIGPGIYDIPPACAKTNTGNGCWDLLVSAPMTLTNVTFYLEAGAHMAVNLGGNGGAVTDTGPYNAGTGQANDGKLVVYGLGGSSLSVVGNNTTVTFQTGSIYMPGGTVDGGGSSAGALVMDGGQAVTDVWNVSTGNHPNPLIVYNPSFSPSSTETFRLVE